MANDEFMRSRGSHKPSILKAASALHTEHLLHKVK
jgi:hypothetical protein